MIALKRDSARRFHAVAVRCFPGGRHKGPTPVTITTGGGHVILRAALDGVGLEARFPADGEEGRVVVPLALLREVAGVGDGVVELHAEAGHGRAAWDDRGVCRESTFAVPAADPGGTEVYPTRWSAPLSNLLPALRAAVCTAARRATRYALHRVRLAGSTGEIIATDGARALLHGGFAFPFSEDVLVPAVAVFGVPELASLPARIGRTPAAIVVAAGDWTVWMAIDSAGRYPDVWAAVPRHTLASLTLGEGDAASLRAELAGRPEPDSDGSLTLALIPPRARVVTRSGQVGRATARPLADSAATGATVRIAVCRDDLARLLDLGLRTIRFAGPGAPFVAADATRTYLATVAAAAATNSDSVAPSARLPEETLPMRLESDGKPTASSEAVTDPLAEAEGLRDALAEATRRAARLLAALKAGRRERKALGRVFSGLKSLNLDP